MLESLHKDKALRFWAETLDSTQAPGRETRPSLVTKGIPRPTPEYRGSQITLGQPDVAWQASENADLLRRIDCLKKAIQKQ